jgi:very-short-patch-repair endonuclease
LNSNWTNDATHPAFGTPLLQREGHRQERVKKVRTPAKQTARLLRQNQTPAEEILWKNLKNRKWKGLKFNRQFPIPFNYHGQSRFFIADFYCHELKLVIEVDGGIHSNQKEYDQLRTIIISMLNIRVIRFSNEQIITDVKAVLQSITL